MTKWWYTLTAHFSLTNQHFNIMQSHFERFNEPSGYRNVLCIIIYFHTEDRQNPKGESKNWNALFIDKDIFFL